MGIGKGGNKELYWGARGSMPQMMTREVTRRGLVAPSPSPLPVTSQGVAKQTKNDKEKIALELSQVRMYKCIFKKGISWFFLEALLVVLACIHIGATYPYRFAAAPLARSGWNHQHNMSKRTFELGLPSCALVLATKNPF